MNDISLVPAGSRWRHYRTGDVYVVVGHSRDERNAKLRVHYVPEGRQIDVPWSRPLEEWLEPVATATRYTEIR